MPADPLSATFTALADPTRRAILARLALGDATVNELAQPFDITVQAVSKHLKILERGGLIVRTRAAQARPSRLAPGAFREIQDWLDAYRRHWDARLDRLDAYLAEIQGKETSGGGAR